MWYAAKNSWFAPPASATLQAPSQGTTKGNRALDSGQEQRCCQHAQKGIPRCHAGRFEASRGVPREVNPGSTSGLVLQSGHHLLLVMYSCRHRSIKFWTCQPETGIGGRSEGRDSCRHRSMRFWTCKSREG